MRLIVVIAFALASAAAQAADLDMFTPQPMAWVAPRWEGFSAGLQAGAVFVPSDSETMIWFPSTVSTVGLPNAFTSSTTGFIGGAQIGFAKQWGSFVLGGVTDYDLVGGGKARSGASGVYPTIDPFGAPLGVPFRVSQSQQLQSLGTVRAKVGFAPIDDMLIYATGGLAFGRTSLSSNTAFAATAFGPGVDYSGVRSDMRIGFAVGGGVEYAIDRHWSTSLEALYYDLGRSAVVGIPNAVTGAENDTSASFNGYTLRLGLNYEFDGDQAEQEAPQQVAQSDITVTLGERVGFSVGGSRLNLYDVSGKVLLSRLTYHNPTAVTGEVYGRVDDSSGVFIKGFAGIGRQSGGTLQDEDFPPTTSPYSSTNSPQQYGRVGYATIDAGYYAVGGPWYRLGGLAGFNYLEDGFNAYGCTETAANPLVCSPPGIVSPSNLTISDDNIWRSARLGLVGKAILPAGFTVEAEAAWLPITFFNGKNDHWLRMPTDFLGPIPETGIGHNGFQVEGQVDYTLARNFDIGVGARYWSLNARGHMLFGDATPLGGSQVATFSAQRFQAFAQSAYHF